MTSPLVKRFLVNFDENKLLSLFSFVVIVGASGFVSMLIPPPEPIPTKYQASGTLSYAPQPPTFTETGATLQQQGQETISEGVLLSDQILKPIATQTELEPELLIEQTEIEFPDEDDKEEGKPFAIDVKYTDVDPERAAATATLLMKYMVDQSRALNTAMLRARIDSLRTRLALAQREQESAEKAFYKFISQEGAALVAAEDGTLFTGISGAQQQQRQLRLTLEGVDAQIQSISARLGLTSEQAYTSSILSADPIIGNLRGQLLDIEMQINPLEEKLRPEHPQMKQLLEQKQGLEKLLQERYAELIGTGLLVPLPGQIRKESSLDPARQELANRLVNLQTQKDTLVSQLVSLQRQERELKQQYERFPTKQLEKARLQQQMQLKQTLSTNMLSALVDAQSAEAETTGSLSIAQPPVLAQIPGETPGGLHPLVAIGGGTVLGFLISGGLIFLLSMFDNRLHTSKEIQAILSEREVMLLGELPFIFNLDANLEETPILRDYNLSDLHFYELVRSSIRRRTAKAPKIVLVTSVMEGEGKTVMAYNLAIASASAGKRTLLLEADLRSPSAASHFQMQPDPDAKLEPLSYYGSRSEYLQLVPEVENLYIVPSAGPQAKAALVLESSEMRRLLEDARGRFDLVIIDSPSLSVCNDTLLLEPLADGLIVTTRPGVTQKPSLESTLDRIIEAELPLLGAVINGVPRSELSTPSHYDLEEEQFPRFGSGNRVGELEEDNDAQLPQEIGSR
ncbi:AAA family ATPase [Lusitaniella coriacea LEGE 07157]|uniref:non-specific protein-tyrosine kinase n=1 Tax=Lusitaniella coriacea LEGE 07157 TaxID=945747 RepID=A0A8J7E0A9_9CYAN|nr:tyrosine-protein kinase domain-containing protein [Lusitaniella coriacea]MBE9118655.1 AAA family ATPase [Lusitaniella coriacea LEGE 07157]